MKLDIKLPIGLIFTILGILFIVYGAFTASDVAFYDKALGYNVNLYTGIIMLVFGAVMLALARKDKKSAG
jgi:uncharacterized membrane protein